MHFAIRESILPWWRSRIPTLFSVSPARRPSRFFSPIPSNGCKLLGLLEAVQALKTVSLNISAAWKTQISIETAVVRTYTRLMNRLGNHTFRATGITAPPLISIPKNAVASPNLSHPDRERSRTL
jgi:hypothetical protein